METKPLAISLFAFHTPYSCVQSTRNISFIWNFICCCRAELFLDLFEIVHLSTLHSFGFLFLLVLVFFVVFHKLFNKVKYLFDKLFDHIDASETKSKEMALGIFAWSIDVSTFVRNMIGRFQALCQRHETKEKNMSGSRFCSIGYYCNMLHVIGFAFAISGFFFLFKIDKKKEKRKMETMRKESKGSWLRHRSSECPM